MALVREHRHGECRREGGGKHRPDGTVYLTKMAWALCLAMPLVPAPPPRVAEIWGWSGDAPFADLGDLGVDLCLRGDFSASGSGGVVDPGIERATMEVVEDLDSNDEGSNDSGIDMGGDPDVEKVTGEVVAELWAEGEQVGRGKDCEAGAEIGRVCGGAGGEI